MLEQAAPRGHLHVAEICAGFFGWPLERPFVRFGDPGYERMEPRPQEGERAGDLIPFALPIRYFSRQRIGAREYRRVMATISRTITRLMARGLMERWFYGHAVTTVSITDQGRALLSVNTSMHSTTRNQYSPESR